MPRRIRRKQPSRSRSHLRFSGLLAGLTLLVLLAGLSGIARASSVTNVSVTNTPPSAAVRARTTYAVTFTTSAPSGALIAGNHITITFAPGTDLSTVVSSTVSDTTTGTAVGNCPSLSGVTATCVIFNGNTIAAGDNVKVVINGITNPATASAANTASVSTTSDTTAANSSPYAVVAGNQITNLSVTNTPPSAAVRARTQYTINFKTSPTGGLAGVANSRVILTFAPGHRLEHGRQLNGERHHDQEHRGR